MNLTRSQKKYLKKNLKKIPLKEIADNLKISENELSSYLKSQWGDEKYQNFVKRQKEPENIENKLPISHSNWKIFALLALLIFVVYFNSLGNDFVSDDISSIVNFSAFGSVSSFLYSTFPFFSPIHFFRYFISFLGKIPFPYHLISILFHLGSTYLLFRILIKMQFKTTVSFFACLLFAVHPLMTEAVAWISGIPYSQSAFFLLLSFLTYLIYKETGISKKIYLISLSSFLLALLTSEKTIVFPLILFLYELTNQKNLQSLKSSFKYLFPYFAISGLWAVYLLGLMGTRISTLQTVHYQKPETYNPLIQIPVAITSYLELIFWPKNLTLYHSEMSFSQVEYFLRLGVFIFFLGLTIWFFKKDRRIFFWLSFFLISLLPTLTPFGISWIVAERYVYLGTIGIIVPIVVLIEYIGRKVSEPKIAYVILTILLLILGTRTILRNDDWKNQDTLWLSTAKTSPSSAQNHNNLGDYYGRQGNFEKAVEEFQTAIKLQPNYGDAYHNLGNTYQQVQKYDLALASYQKALEFNPNLWQSLVNIGIIYYKNGDKQKAQEEFQKALKIDPQNAKIKELLLQTSP